MIVSLITPTGRRDGRRMEWEMERSYLSSSSTDTMTRRSVPGRETLAGNDESSRVGSKVEEELSKNIDSQQAVGREMVVGKTHDNEEDS